jgi:hypothetical protein
MFESGQKAEWLYSPRGGYGYQWWIPVVIVEVKGKRTVVRVKKVDGSEVMRSVKTEKLRPLTTPDRGRS